jgi:RNA polymerase sigma factor (sigma-70 family)
MTPRPGLSGLRAAGIPILKPDPKPEVIHVVREATAELERKRELGLEPKSDLTIMREEVRGRKSRRADAVTALRRSRALRDGIGKLPTREREVIELRYGLDSYGIERHPHTLKEVAVLLDVSPQRVHQIQDRALRMLRVW